MLLSAESGVGFEYLENQIKKHLEPTHYIETVFLSFNDTKKRAWLFNKKIVTDEILVDNGFSITVQWSVEQRNYFFNES